MVISDSCGIELVDTLSRFWLFLKSDECQILFLILASIRALFYYLLRSPLREAKELAYAMAATGLFAAWIAISESPRPQWAMKLAERCTYSTGYASSDRTPSRVVCVRFRKMAGP